MIYPRRQRIAQVPLVLSLEPIIRCPNPDCRRLPYSNGDVLVITCAYKYCRSHWWATRLEAGDIRSQILAQFDGNDLFVELLDILGAPERIDQPMYWQLWLSGGTHHAMVDARQPGGIIARSHELVRGIVQLHRRPR